MIPREEARQYVLERCVVLPALRVPLAAATWLVLAETVIAGEDVPPFANSAVDGYAVRSADFAGGGPLELRVVGEVAAGAVSTHVLAPGEAIRIMTGAPMPGGADASVMVEDTERLDGGSRVLVRSTPRPGDAIRGAGDDVLAGTALFEPGTVVTPAVAGVLASGAFSAASAFEPVTPRRIVDTRPDSRAGYTGAKPAAGQVLEIQVAGNAPGLAPEGTAAVVLNLTATETEGGGYVVVEPCALPTATSALNVSAGATTANLVVAPVSETGTVCLRTQRPAHLLLDLFGWFPADASYHAIRPLRLLDTRTLGDAPLAAGTTYQLWIGETWILPSDTTAVVLDVVGVGATAPGYVTVWPCSSPRPATSNLNLDGPDPAASLVLTGIAPGDNVCLFTQNGAHLVVDLFGYTVLR